MFRLLQFLTVGAVLAAAMAMPMARRDMSNAADRVEPAGPVVTASLPDVAGPLTAGGTIFYISAPERAPASLATLRMAARLARAEWATSLLAASDMDIPVLTKRLIDPQKLKKPGSTRVPLIAIGRPQEPLPGSAGLDPSPAIATAALASQQAVLAADSKSADRGDKLRRGHKLDRSAAARLPVRHAKLRDRPNGPAYASPGTQLAFAAPDTTLIQRPGLHAIDRTFVDAAQYPARHDRHAAQPTCRTYVVPGFIFPRREVRCF